MIDNTIDVTFMGEEYKEEETSLVVKFPLNLLNYLVLIVSYLNIGSVSCCMIYFVNRC